MVPFASFFLAIFFLSFFLSSFFLLPLPFFLSQTLERAVFCFDGKDTVVNGKLKSKTSLLLSEVCPEVLPTTTILRRPVRGGAAAAVSSICLGRVHTPS